VFWGVAGCNNNRCAQEKTLTNGKAVILSTNGKAVISKPMVKEVFYSTNQWYNNNRIGKPNDATVKQ
jgi:hypothetical protein